MNARCIRYSVDCRLLNEGIPVEQLEKRNVQEFRSGETLQHLNRYAQGTQRLHKDYPKPKPPDKLEIELGLSDYSKVRAGELIKISPETAKHNGEKFKIRYKGTDSYVVRSLVVIGDRGYFQCPTTGRRAAPLTTTLQTSLRKGGASGRRYRKYVGINHQLNRLKAW